MRRVSNDFSGLICSLHTFPVHQHHHMHQHQHALTPILHQSLAILPQSQAILPLSMRTQDPKFHEKLRGTTRPSFAPAAVFQRPTQKSVPSATRGRWGALHVCIAWKIYHHEQRKRMQQKSNSLNQEPTPEHPATVPPDSMQHKESDQTTRHAAQNNPCGHPGAPAEHLSRLRRICPSDLCTPPPCHSRTIEGKTPDSEEQEEDAGLQPRETERHSSHRTSAVNYLPARDHSRDRAEPDVLISSLNRKRPHGGSSLTEVKRMKPEIADNRFDSTVTLHARPSTHTVPVQQAYVAGPLGMYSTSSRGHVTRTPWGFTSYTGAEMHPSRRASSESVWDLHSRTDPHAFADYTVNACKAASLVHLARRQGETSNAFCAPPFYFPPAVRQETLYQWGREFLHPHQGNCCRHQLPHPGFLAPSYLGTCLSLTEKK